MAKAVTQQTTVVSTERGLSIAGTRITLYTIMDYLKADWPPELIQHWFDLTDQQIAEVITYIEDNRDQVEAEYQQVLEYAAERRRYWEEQNQERLAQIRKLPPPPGKEELWAKLQAWKASMVEE